MFRHAPTRADRSNLEVYVLSETYRRRVMPTPTITVTQAREDFAELVNRVA